MIYIWLLLPAALAAAALCHRWLLWQESKKLLRLGTPVTVAGHSMNVLTEGPRDGSAIVLLSGSGVAAPIYEYRVLYEKLTGNHPVTVIEKFGYGYADTSGLPRDTATLVAQNRAALHELGIAGPYVLMAHSMAALEALYWSDQFPGEVRAIIGLDMAVPHSYTRSNMAKITFFRVMTFFGLHRIPAFNQVNCQGLTAAQQDQHRWLTNRNTLNADVYEECRSVLTNARMVAQLPAPTVPLLLFTTNLAGAKGHEGWVNAQTEFARQAPACRQIKMKCGHNLHAEVPDYLAQEILAFLQGLPEAPDTPARR